jgi:UDP-N-acetylmuramoylalanine--D-glutamate ligase
LQAAKCLSIVITGTNGKSTTAGLVERVLVHNHRKTLVGGHQDRPICSVAEQTKDLDFLIVRANSFQLESTQFFRPVVAVLLNVAPDHTSRYAESADYIRAMAGLFRHQQAFDWAVIQSEALVRLRALALPVPAKTITFSATDPTADLHLDRGLIISSLPNWSGPLLDTGHCMLRGPHNAENLMAALAVGHALRLPLETMVDSLKTCAAAPHRCELVAEVDGVQFIDDAKAANLDALQKALLATRPGPGGEGNVWLIAGGQGPGLEFHDVGPILSRRVKRAFLIGEAAEKIRAAWSLFTPCQVTVSLLEAVSEAAKNAASGDVVLFSPACPGFDQFRDYEQRGESFCQAVKSIPRGALAGTPYMNGTFTTA